MSARSETVTTAKRKRAERNAGERELAFGERMSDHEALMWNIEKDPWLNPNGSSLTILDQPVDMERFRRQVRFGVSRLPRLYQRVVPGLGRISTPAWAPDPEFDFDFHLKQIDLPAPGTERQLFDLAAQLSVEPMDRTRPLWRFVVIGGVEGGRGAIWSIFHHAISDGIGQIRMAELYQQMTRDDEGHPEVDLEGIVAEAVAATDAKEVGGPGAASLLDTTTRSVTHLMRRQWGFGRRLLGEVMLWPADAGRAADKAGGLVSTLHHTLDQMTGSSNEKPGGSPLWKQRSRHRHLEYVRVELDEIKAPSKEVGASINDAFMAGLVNGAVEYHRKRDVEVEALNTSFVVSTRSDSAIGGNSFTPVVVQFDGRSATPEERMREVTAGTETAREAAGKGGGINSLAGVANLLPTSVVTRTARDRAAKIDFATSNLRGAPFPLYCAGGKVEATICLGPLAGTAANITALSYDGHFDMGIVVDPVAIDDPEDFRNCIQQAFADLVAVGADEVSASKKKSPKPKSGSTKSGSKPPRKKKPAKAAS